MNDFMERCKHGVEHMFQCHMCFMEYAEDKREKSAMDTLHEKLSELQIRIAKLEQYKLLQEDINNEHLQFIKILIAHKNQQIDENRCISRHFDQLNEDHAELNSRQNDLVADIELLQGWKDLLDTDCGSAHEKIIKLEHKSKMHDAKYDEYECYNIRISELEEYKRLQDDFNTGQISVNTFHVKELEKLATKYGECELNSIRTNIRMSELEKNARYMMGDPSVQIHKPETKTTGLTFEEAIISFKLGHKIKRVGFPMTLWMEKCAHTYIFSLDDLMAKDWEILD